MINEIDPDGKIKNVDKLLRKLNDKFVSRLEVQKTLRKRKKRETSLKHRQKREDVPYCP